MGYLFKPAAFLVAFATTITLFAQSASKVPEQPASRAALPAHLAALHPNLKRLRLIAPDEAMIGAAVRFSELESLEIVDSHGRALGDLPPACFDGLADLKQLKSVSLTRATLLPEHMAAFGKCTGLTSLSITYSEIRGADDSDQAVKCMRFLEGCSKLRDLNLECTTFWASKETLDDFASIPDLRHLNLSNGSRPRSAEALRMAARCKKLESLSIRHEADYYPIEAGDIEVLGGMTSLTNLELALLNATPDLYAALGTSLGKLTSLTQLELSVSRNFDNSCANVLAGCTALTALTVKGGSDYFRGLAKLTKLKSLEIVQSGMDAIYFDGAKLAFLKDFKKLENLHLAGGWHMDDLQEPLAKLKQLRRLSLFCAREMGNAAWIGKLKWLEKLELQVDASTSDTDLATLLTGCSKLKQLVLVSHTFAPVVAKAIGGLASLESLTLAPVDPQNQSAPGPEALTSTKSLTTFVLSNFTTVPETLIKTACTKLKLTTLDLNGCPDVYTLPVFTAVGECTTLDTLRITCRQPQGFGADATAADEAVGKLRKLASLRVLTLAIPALSNESLKPIGELTALRRLDLSGCPLLTGEGLAALGGLVDLEVFVCARKAKLGEGLKTLEQKIAFQAY